MADNFMFSPNEIESLSALLTEQCSKNTDCAGSESQASKLPMRPSDLPTAHSSRSVQKQPPVPRDLPSSHKPDTNIWGDDEVTDEAYDLPDGRKVPMSVTTFGVLGGGFSDMILYTNRMLLPRTCTSDLVRRIPRVRNASISSLRLVYSRLVDETYVADSTPGCADE